MYNSRQGYRSLSTPTLITLLCVCFLVMYICFSISENNATSKINDKVERIDGTIISIDTVGLFEAKPFAMTKHDTAYKFTYKVAGEVKEGWYKQGYKDKWIMDYTK